MKIKKTKIAGCYEIEPIIHLDARGSLVKFFEEEQFLTHKLPTCFAEDFYSKSSKGVLRGMHFQTPPAAYSKIVCCLFGEVFDAIVDLRIGSETFGQHETFELSAKVSHLLYLPAGVAHGFYVLSSEAILLYKTSFKHSPANDGGIHWSSAGVPWPNNKPIVSERDAKLQNLKDYKSPFIYEKI
ncbi:dTDP-4-dehydrorhamnose 3,5-epimerase family protein [Candidatus Saganbacteria bacterium]|nr:dTDP-4-dehydrorhamnose 3,5-epimerase family protein [Candidatus Saganbacteria bacterium]